MRYSEYDEDGPNHPFPDQSPPFVWQGKNIQWCDGTYAIAVDDPHDATYVSVWTEDNRCIGRLTTRGRVLSNHLSIGTSELDKRHRGRKIGYLMYQTLLSCLSPKWKGIATYLPDQVNVRQVPAIWKKLGGYSPAGNGDFLVSDK